MKKYKLGQLILFLFVQFISLKAYSREVRQSELGRSNSISVNRSSAIQPACPLLLEQWVDDDFKDQSSWGFKYKSEARSCQAPVEAYKDFISKKQMSRNFSDAKALGSFLNEKFSKKINPMYRGVLSKCDHLSTPKASVIYTRFYSAGTKLEAANSAVIEELAYLDSVLPESRGVLAGVECPPIWPELRDKCNVLKEAGNSCSSDKQKRFDELVKKTQANLVVIENLVASHHSCLNKFYSEPGAKVGRGYAESTRNKIKTSCDPIAAAIEIKRNEVPWIRGEDFQKIAVKKKPSPRNGVFVTEYDLTNETVAKAVAKQLNYNRTTLTSSYKSNLDDFRCLSNGSVDGQQCDFNKIRSHLQKLPDLRGSVFSASTSLEKEANTYFEAENCLLERTEDRHQTRVVVDGSMEGITLTAATFGAGQIVGGVRALNAAGTLGRVRQGALVANVGFNASITGHDLYHAYNECSSERQSLIDIAKRADVHKDNLCAQTSASLAQAAEKENNCLVTALLTAPSVLPFVGAIPSLKNLFHQYRPPKTSEIALTDDRIIPRESRGKLAETVLNRPLSERESNALEAAHHVGAGEIGKDGKNLASINNYTDAHIREKARILKEGGFNGEERRRLIEAGIAGYRNQSRLQVNIGSQVLIPRSHGGRSLATVRRIEDDVAIVTWEEGGRQLSKAVPLNELSLPNASQMQVGTPVIVQRSDGSENMARISRITDDPDSPGEKLAVVRWEQNGTPMSKTVPLNELRAPESFNAGDAVMVPRTTGGYSAGRIQSTDGVDAVVVFEDQHTGQMLIKRVEVSDLKRLSGASEKPQGPTAPPQPHSSSPGLTDRLRTLFQPERSQASVRQAIGSEIKSYRQDRIFLDYGTPKTDQGFKLHVSAQFEDTEKVAQIVLPELRRRGVAHKIVDSRQNYQEVMTGTQRGKLVTIYPDSDQQAAEIARVIDQIYRQHNLRGIPIQGERGVGQSGAVFVRYGQFTDRKPGLVKPDGSIVPDIRGNQWKPDWAPDPFTDLR